MGAQGGTVTLGGKEVVAQAGSRMNLAGGTLDVAEGVINLSWLRGADGRTKPPARRRTGSTPACTGLRGPARPLGRRPRGVS